MKALVDAVQVCRPLDTVFAFITNFSHVTLIFEHLSAVIPSQSGQLVEGSLCQQTRIVHGLRYNETVEVIRLKNNNCYTIRIRNFGIETDYDYRFAALSPAVTHIQLTKTAHAKGWSKLLLPLTHHVLTRPEHDGKHLQVLKAAIEKYCPSAIESQALNSGRE